MCDVCVSAAKELDAFLQDLVKRYPGTSIDGQEVNRYHHVGVALVTVAPLYIEELMGYDEEDETPELNSIGDVIET